LYAYAEVARPDAMTARLRALCDHWRSTCGLGDAQVAELIRADGIDVLVDLAGHTAASRLLVFARKPAPVQVSYLGYPATTGLDAMDYRLTDAYAEPAGTSEQWYVERLVRLPRSLWCYRPLDDMPEVSPAPAGRNGYVTFGSFNNFAKIGARVIDLWAQLLRAVPDSRLFMICVPEGEAQHALIERFTARGVAAERLQLHGRLPRAAYLAAFGNVDVALDPFPCNGGTTTCDALWMGLPVLALIGDTFLSRAGLSLLAAAGLAELAAATPEAYLAIGAGLSADIDALAARRATMRALLRGSALMDAPAFARDVELAYRDMWRHWCAQRT
jgi:predicted O-linked N-acetylglucosamine transferase (SPINDLY family)